MNTTEAKKILALYRPHSAPGEDPAVAEALEIARRDPELKQWLEIHGAFQTAMHDKLQQIDIPPELKERILANSKVVRPRTWIPSPLWFSAAAAAVALLIGMTAILLFKPAPREDFTIFRSRMVGTALREYRMDIVTNDPVEIRRFLAEHNAPADYALPPALEHLELTGAGLLRWQNQPVSMVCFDRGDRQMLFLFVVDAATIHSPPPAKPIVGTVNKLLTAAWTEADRTYLLAGPADTDLLRSHLIP